MKKTILFIAICLAFINVKGQGLRLGIHADPQITWLTSDTKKITSNGAAFGYNFGLNFDNYFAKNYAITSGISLNTYKGGLNYQDSLSLTTKDDTYNFNNQNSIDYEFQYVNIPLGIKLKTNQIGYFTYYANVGFNSYINLNSKVSESTLNIEKETLEGEIRFFNLDYFFGLGLQYSLGSAAAINFGVNYAQGFVDIFIAENNTAYTRNVNFTIGMVF